MIEIARLSVSRVFLFKEQTYRGRCLVAYKEHVNDLFALSEKGNRLSQHLRPGKRRWRHIAAKPVDFATH
jgi:hypothetical protein